MLVTRYLQERLLYRLSISRFYDHFFLKGGALLYAHERFLARPTLDIDFMGYHIDNNKENIKKISGKWKTWNMILKKTVIVVKTGKC